MGSDSSFCEGVPPKHVDSFKLPRAGTVEKFKEGFVPAISKRHHEARGDATAAHHPMQPSAPRNLPDKDIQSDTIVGHEQVMSLFHRLPSNSVDKCKSTTNVQLETKTQSECVAVSHVVNGGPYGAVTDALVGGTCVETLLDTGSTTNLVRSEVARSPKDKPEMRPYEGQLLTADGRRMKVEGRITKLKIREVDDDIEALFVPELRNQMVL